MCGTDIFLGVLAILFPPLAVWIKRGICSVDSLINIALCVLGYLPGLLHAWYIISAYPDPTYDELRPDEEGGRAYVVVGGPAPGQQRHYGTVGPAQTADGQYRPQQGGMAPVSAHGGPSSGGAQEVPPPPPYQESIQGDNKVQRQD